MNKAPPTRWYTPWRSPAVHQDDWADLGTAFGLDMSMDDSPPQATGAAQPEPRSIGWVRRLTNRRRAPA